MLALFTAEDVLSVASQYEVDQSDMLESFLCELLDVKVDKLYELIEEAVDED